MLSVELHVKQPISRRARTERLVGATLLGLGVLLLVVTGGYYAYGVVARSDLDRFSYSKERPTATGEGYASVLANGDETKVSGGSVSSVEAPGPVEARAADETARDGSGDEAAQQTDESGVPLQAETTPVDSLGGEAEQADGELAITSNEELSGPVQVAEATDVDTDDGQVDSTAAIANGDGGLSTEVDDADAAASSSQSEVTAFDVNSIDPSYFESQKAALVASAIEASITEAAMYSPPASVDLLEDPLPATHIRIPAVNVDSEVKDLEVRFLADSYAWETPNKVVGHIPTTAYPGEDGQGWYFGHLESFVRGEGNVFRRLPEIPILVEENPIYIFLEAPDRSYLYQVYHAETVDEDDLRITDSGLGDITLVTCVPRFYYDHRLLVVAALVGVSDPLATREGEVEGTVDSGL